MLNLVCISRHLNQSQRRTHKSLPSVSVSLLSLPGKDSVNTLLRQRIHATTETYAFSMRSVSYQRKVCGSVYPLTDARYTSLKTFLLFFIQTSLPLKIISIEMSSLRKISISSFPLSCCLTVCSSVKTEMLQRHRKEVQGMAMPVRCCTIMYTPPPPHTHTNM
jgi:hypothetical protein